MTKLRVIVAFFAILRTCLKPRILGRVKGVITTFNNRGDYIYLRASCHVWIALTVSETKRALKCGIFITLFLHIVCVMSRIYAAITEVLNSSTKHSGHVGQ
jgi:hypothetical protein